MHCQDTDDDAGVRTKTSSGTLTLLNEEMKLFFSRNDCSVLDKLMLLYQRKPELELRKPSIINKSLFQTHQRINNRVFDEIQLMEMLLQRRDVRGS